MAAHRRKNAWVFLKGRHDLPPIGARVELVERRQARLAGPDGGSGGPYAWAMFPETPYGTYTVRVDLPDGGRRAARLVVDASLDSITLDAAENAESPRL